MFIFKEITTEDRAYFLNGENSYWLCRKCHNKYEKKADALRNDLLKTHSFPEDSHLNFHTDIDLKKIKNLCRFLSGLYHENSYNYDMCGAYEYVKDFYKNPHLRYFDILKLADITVIKENENYIKMGKFLVEHAGVEVLDGIYRQHLYTFLTSRHIKKKGLITLKNKYYTKNNEI